MMMTFPRLETFARLPAQEKVLLGQALVALVAFRLGLWLLPFRRVSAVMRHVRRERERTVSPARVLWCVQTASRFVPRATCLVQALTARALLNRAGIRADVQIGVAKSADGSFQAHAWVECLAAPGVKAADYGQYTPMLSLESSG